MKGNCVQIFILVFLFTEIRSETVKESLEDVALYNEESKLKEYVADSSNLEDDYYDDYYYDDEYEDLSDPGPPNPLTKILPLVKFKCDTLIDGYYADIDFDCKVFHYCQNKKRHTFMCPPKSWFNQQNMICDFDELASDDCESSTRYFNNKNKQLTEQISKKQKIRPTKRAHQIPAPPPRTTTPAPTTPTVYIGNDPYTSKRRTTETYHHKDVSTRYKQQTSRPNSYGSVSSRPKPTRKRPSNLSTTGKPYRYKPVRKLPKEQERPSKPARHTPVRDPYTDHRENIKSPEIYPPASSLSVEPQRHQTAQSHDFDYGSEEYNLDGDYDSTEQKPIYYENTPYPPVTFENQPQRSKVTPTEKNRFEQPSKDRTHFQQGSEDPFSDSFFDFDDDTEKRIKQNSNGDKVQTAGTLNRPHRPNENLYGPSPSSFNRNRKPTPFTQYQRPETAFQFSPKQKYVSAATLHQVNRRPSGQQFLNYNFGASENSFKQSSSNYHSPQVYRNKPSDFKQNNQHFSSGQFSNFKPQSNTFTSFKDRPQVFHSFRYPDQKNQGHAQQNHHRRFKRDLENPNETLITAAQTNVNNKAAPPRNTIFDPTFRLTFPEPQTQDFNNRRQLRLSTFNFPNLNSASGKINFDDRGSFSSGSELRQQTVSNPQSRRTSTRADPISDFFRVNSFQPSFSLEGNRNAQSSRNNNQVQSIPRGPTPARQQNFRPFATSNDRFNAPVFENSPERSVRPSEIVRTRQPATSSQRNNDGSNQFRRDQSFQSTPRRNQGTQARPTFSSPPRDNFSDQRNVNRFRQPVSRHRQQNIPEIFVPSSFDQFSTRTPNFRNFEPQRPTIVTTEPEFQFVPDFGRRPISQFQNSPPFEGRPESSQGPRTEFGSRPETVTHSRRQPNFVGSVIYEDSDPVDIPTTVFRPPSQVQRIPNNPINLEPPVPRRPASRRPPPRRPAQTETNRFSNPFDIDNYRSPPKNRRIPSTRPHQIENPKDDRNKAGASDISDIRNSNDFKKQNPKPIDESVFGDIDVRDQKYQTPPPIRTSTPTNLQKNRKEVDRKPNNVQRVPPKRQFSTTIDPFNSEFGTRKPPRTSSSSQDQNRNKDPVKPLTERRRRPLGTNRRPQETKLDKEEVEDTNRHSDSSSRRKPFGSNIRRPSGSNRRPPIDHDIRVSTEDSLNPTESSQRRPLTPQRPVPQTSGRPRPNRNRPPQPTDRFPPVRKIPQHLNERPVDINNRRPVDLNNRNPDFFDQRNPFNFDEVRANIDSHRSRRPPPPPPQFGFQNRPFNLNEGNEPIHDQRFKRPTVLSSENEQPFSPEFTGSTEPFTRFPPVAPQQEIQRPQKRPEEERRRPVEAETHIKTQNGNRNINHLSLNDRFKPKSTARSPVNVDEQIQVTTNEPTSPVSSNTSPPLETTSQRYRPTEKPKPLKKLKRRPSSKRVSTSNTTRKPTEATTEAVSVPTTKRSRTRSRRRNLKRRRQRLQRRRSKTTTTAPPTTEDHTEAETKTTKPSRKPGVRRTRYRSRLRKNRKRVRSRTRSTTTSTTTTSTTTTTTTKRPRKAHDDRSSPSKEASESFESAKLATIPQDYEGRQQKSSSVPTTTSTESSKRTKEEPSPKADTRRVKNVDNGGRIFNNQRTLNPSYQDRLRQLARMRLKKRLQEITTGSPVSATKSTTVSSEEFTQEIYKRPTTSEVTTEAQEFSTEQFRRKPTPTVQTTNAPIRRNKNPRRRRPTTTTEDSTEAITESNKNPRRRRPKTTTEDSTVAITESNKNPRRRRPATTTEHSTEAITESNKNPRRRRPTTTTEDSTEAITESNKNPRKRRPTTTTEDSTEAITESNKNPSSTTSEDPETSSSTLPKTAVNSRKTSKYSNRLKALRRRRLRLIQRRRNRTTKAPAESEE